MDSLETKFHTAAAERVRLKPSWIVWARSKW